MGYMTEIAIPVAALGLMYILSNKKKNIESFETSRKTYNKLPNTQVPVVNYPVETYSELKEHPSRYNKPNNLKQRYYDPQVHKNVFLNERKSEEGDMFTSLTGTEVPIKNFSHQ